MRRKRNQSRLLCWSQTNMDMTQKVKAYENNHASTTEFMPQLALIDSRENALLYQYEESVKKSFDVIVPTLKRISSLQHSQDFEFEAQKLAQDELGYTLPEEILGAAWLGQLDMQALYAWCVFKTYTVYCDEFFAKEPLRRNDAEVFQNFLQECGFHTLDVSPCADGRLAHVIRYVLRLPIEAVRRKSYAGAMFDIDNSIEKWVETEMLRYREGRPNKADEPTRYLKAVAYHFSSIDADHEGCAAHGSNDELAANQGLERLEAFKQAIENTFCCGASIDLLLLGIDTATDSIKVHIPNGSGDISTERCIDTRDMYQSVRGMSLDECTTCIAKKIREIEADVCDGMVKLISRLIINNFSQIEYVKKYFKGQYDDIGHAERFIGAGIGFEEVQLRNLTYFAYLNTLEESTQDMDVGIKIFNKLNMSCGLPAPVIVRFDYHGQVPGARERAIERCQRVVDAIQDRYEDIYAEGMLHTLMVIRDCNKNMAIEITGSSINASFEKGRD